MPKRDEELEYEYEEEAEGYDEDEYEDEEYDDEEYEDDEDEEEGSGSGVMRPVLYGVGLLVVLGAGYYAYSNGMLPFSPKQPDAVQTASSPYANPNGFGKVKAAPGVPSIAKAVPGKTASASAGGEQAANDDKDAEKPAPAPKAPAKPAKVAAKPEAKPAAEKPAKLASAGAVAHAPAVHAAKPVKHVAPVHKAVVPKAPAKVAAKHPVVHVAVGGGHYAVQCGAFASSSNANNLAHVLSAKGFPSWVWNGAGQSSGAFAVRSTVVDTQAKANALKAKFAGAGHPGAVLSTGHHHYVVQLGLFSQRDRASEFAKELNAKNMFVSVSGGTARMHTATKVLVGKFGTWGQASAEASKVRKQGVPAIVVHL